LDAEFDVAEGEVLSSGTEKGVVSIEFKTEV
jgi:hypothetical protein